MIDRLFRRHPRNVGEGYFEHMHSALGFGATMLVAGVACLIHAFLPNCFERTGSKAIAKLHDRLVVNRIRQVVKSAQVEPANATAE